MQRTVHDKYELSGYLLQCLSALILAFSLSGFTPQEKSGNWETA